MGLRSWWRSNRAHAANVRRSLAINDDQELIAVQVPELSGMSDVEGMAYTLQQINEWKATASPEQIAEFSRRGRESMAAFEKDGLTMPYWGSLWILRTYQKSLGLDAPAVAPPVQNSN
jgi:hypothetical protein